jgi:hypothetical protein
MFSEIKNAVYNYNRLYLFDKASYFHLNLCKLCVSTNLRGCFNLPQYYGDQKILAVNFCHFKRKICKPYFIFTMITVLIMIGHFWLVNFKIRNYFVIYYTDVYLRLLFMYDYSNFVHSYRVLGISDL